MTKQLEILLESRRIEPVAVVPGEVGSAWEAAVETLRDSVLEGMSNRTTFTVTYQAALQCCAAVLRGAGYRTTGRDHHHNSFAGVIALEAGDLSRAARDIDRMRLVRHGAVYGIEVTIKPEQVQQMREVTARLFIAAHAWLAETHPGLPFTSPPPG
jgi:hypothetical protein